MQKYRECYRYCYITLTNLRTNYLLMRNAYTDSVGIEIIQLLSPFTGDNAHLEVGKPWYNHYLSFTSSPK